MSKSCSIFHDLKLQAKRAFSTGFILISGLALMGCGSSSWNQPSEVVAVRGEYRIQANDLLEITFAEEPSLTQQVRVTSEGMIYLTYLAANGKAAIMACNLTPNEVASDINRLAEANGLLKQPLSQVRVVEYAERAFSLYGDVRNPGRYAFTPAYAMSISLPEAIAMGGGLTEYANASLIIIKRGSKIYRINLNAILMKPGIRPFAILPGDTITVSRSFF
jgi:polysaccharide export outer membrane protein